MELWGDNLKVDALLMHKLFQAGGEFIVQNLEERAEAAVTEVVMDDLVGTDKFLCAA